MENTRTTLWLIRHGETDWNAARRFQGHLDVPLNSLGKTQAQLLASRLEVEHRTRRFAALCTSDLSRAKDTASATGARTGLPLSLRVGLRERHYGVLGALTHEEMASKHPEVFALWQARVPDYVVPGGESLRHFNRRVMRELLGLAEAHLGQHVLIVTHGGVLDCAYRAARRLPLDAEREHPIHNASINQVLVSATGALELGPWGDTAHLEPAPTRP